MNLNSPVQVAQVLYNLGIFASPRQSTAADELDKVLGEHPIVPLIKEWRELSKLMNTYVVVLKDNQREGRVHTTFRITRVDTGRLSSAGPNLQNQPTRTERGRKIRTAFIAPPSCKLLSVDLSQVEMRVAAHLSQDPSMLRVFREGKDIHTETAARMWGIRVEDVDPKKHRYPAKRIGFGILYGITESGLLDQFMAEGIRTWSLDDCKLMIRDWYRAYPGVSRWMDTVRAEAMRTGRVRDMFGRYRLTPGVYFADRYLREKTLREAVNAPVQSGAQGIIKEAMGQLVPIYRDYQRRGTHLLPLLQIHDELLWEVGEADVSEVAPILQQVMRDAVKLSVPVEVDCAVGNNWAEV